MAIKELPKEKFMLSSSRHFAEWLAQSRSAIAFTTYQAGKTFFVGVNWQGELSIFERTFPRSMGLAVSTDGRTLALTTQHQVYRFDNVMQPGQVSTDGFDAIYAPHAAWITGDVDAHDVGFGPDGRPLFVNTLFSCIASVSDGHSFRPVWKPPFISKLAPEDRCHLNGFALDGGEPRFATAISRSDVADGWRDRRADGGIVIDVATGEVVAGDLSMPHSPRLHNGRLWLLNSGTGEFGFVDLAPGGFEAIAFCPGYARGLAFVENHAVIGLSLGREDRTFSGLALDQALKAHNVDARCGVIVVDLVRGDVAHWVRIEGVVRELYDVAVLPNVRRPCLIGFKGDEIRRIISIEE